MAERKASVARDTLETQIQVAINLDGTGQADFDIGVPFLEHMLDQIARHGLIDMTIKARGDLHIDDHHTVEDVGITLGQAFARAIGDKKGIRRYDPDFNPKALAIYTGDKNKNKEHHNFPARTNSPASSRDMLRSKPRNTQKRSQMA